MIHGVIKLYQHVCRHDYECFGEFHYVMSMKTETVFLCKKCAHDNSFSVPMGYSSNEATFTYQP
jgi:hypothetical protein